MGIHVVPYINGRIFDKGTGTWGTVGAAAAAKRATPAVVSEQQLSTYEESYGSEAKFAVMCPASKSWQTTIAEVVDKLTNTYGVDGVYIDQIAAAGPAPCWDPSHNHSLGGGDHWVSGYTAMLDMARHFAGNDKVLLTEANAEPFMGRGINLFLTLTGFASGSFPSAPTGGTTPANVIVPAFQSVYGGYVLPMGAEFFRNDFLPDPDVFAAKVAVQFVFGAQLGWFSLGGRDNQNPAMGIYDLLLSHEYDDEIRYLKDLSVAKTTAKAWFNHGRAMRPLPIVVNGTTDGAGVVAGAVVGAAAGAVAGSAVEGAVAGAVMSAAWLSEDGDALLLAITTIMRATPAQVTATIDAQGMYGLHVSAASAVGGGGVRGGGGGGGGGGAKCRVVWMPFDGQGGERVEGVYPCNAVDVTVLLGVRAIALLRVEEVKA